MNRLGIILPAYRAAAELPEALDSLLAQTFPYWEAWILDDGSDDATGEVAQAYQRRDRRFHAIALPHRGIPATLNDGLARCRTPLIARMDADEICAPTRFESQLALLETHPRVGLVSCRIRSFHSDGSPPGSGMRRYVNWVNRVLTPEDHFRERYIESPIAHSSILAPRSVLEGGYRDLDWCEDYDLWLTLLQQGVRFAKVPEVLLSVRDDAGRISRNDHRYSQDALRRCKIEHLLDPTGPLHDRRHVLFWGAGRVGKRWLRDLPTFGVDIDAVVDTDPRKIGKRIHDALVIAPEDLPHHWRRLPEPFLVIAVGAPGVRDEIRVYLAQYGHAELTDYLFVA